MLEVVLDEYPGEDCAQYKQCVEVRIHCLCIGVRVLEEYPSEGSEVLGGHPSLG